MKDKYLRATVEYVSPLTDTVLQFILKPSKYIDYQAGQYLQLISDGEAYSYSIANAPLGSHRYELHIRHSRDNQNNQKLLAAMKKQGEVLLHIPLGDCVVNKLIQKKPIIFIAAGSGFAPIKAMLEQLFADSDDRLLKLYWGVRGQNDLYMHEKLLHWQSCMSNFVYTSYLSKVGKESLISVIIGDNIDALLDYQFVMSGPFDLMYAMRDALVQNGVDKGDIFSDAFSFE